MYAYIHALVFTNDSNPLPATNTSLNIGCQ